MRDTTIIGVRPRTVDIVPVLQRGRVEGIKLICWTVRGAQSGCGLNNETFVMPYVSSLPVWV